MKVVIIRRNGARAEIDVDDAVAKGEFIEVSMPANRYRTFNAVQLAEANRHVELDSMDVIQLRRAGDENGVPVFQER